MSAVPNRPRLVIAGLSGDSGKSVVSMALLRALRGAGTEVRAFKKGPDYIDAAWLSCCSGTTARNLDTWLMGFEGAARLFCSHAAGNGFNLVEGNRGLFDGIDIYGTHSTAELAKTLAAPVVLVLDVTKMTRTAVAMVLGCKQLDPDLQLAGVILNRVNGKRHETVCREAIERTCGIPVVGVIAKFENDFMPERHLGLVTPEDHPGMEKLPEALEKVANGLDLARLREIACSARPLDVAPLPEVDSKTDEGTVKIAVIRDAAFSFYYPENLEALQQAGAEIVFVSALHAPTLPEVADAVYIGGGFPEVHAEKISANTGFLKSLAQAAARGLPIYAECGGLMLLSRSIRWNDWRCTMANVLPIDIEVGKAPQGHGYVDATVDAPNAFYPVGTVLRGHEFHYSRLALETNPPNMVCAVRRGIGAYGKRDGLTVNNVWASYTHVHAVGTPAWAPGLVKLARQHRERKQATGEIGSRYKCAGQNR